MNTEVRRILRESARWRTLGLLFECPSPQWREQLRNLVPEIGDGSLASAVAHAIDEASAESYHTTFGPGGPAAPREVTYRDSSLPGQVMGELNAYYNAFAYRAPKAEAPDHVSVEIGFIAYLYLKEAYARARGETEQASVTSEAIGEFVADHLAPMADALANSLAESGISYLTITSKVLAHAVRTVSTHRSTARSVRHTQT